MIARGRQAGRGVADAPLAARPSVNACAQVGVADEFVAATNVVRFVSRAFVGLKKTGGLEGMKGNQLEEVSATLQNVNDLLCTNHRIYEGGG